MNTVPKFIKGKAPSMLEAEIANFVGQVINAVVLAQVSPQGSGKITIADKGAMILDVSPLVGRMSDIEKTIKKLAGDLEKSLLEQIQKDEAVRDELRKLIRETFAAEFEKVKGKGECNDDGGMTITLTYTPTP